MYNIDTCNAFTVWVPMEIGSSVRIKPQSKWKLYREVNTNLHKDEKKKMIKDFYAKFPRIPFVRFIKIKNREYFQVGCANETTRNTVAEDSHDWIREENMDWTNARSLNGRQQPTLISATREKKKILKAGEINCSDAELEIFGITRSEWNKQIQQDEEDEAKRKKFSFVTDMNNKSSLKKEIREDNILENDISSTNASEATIETDVKLMDDTVRTTDPTKDRFYLYNLHAWIGIKDKMSIGEDYQEKIYKDYGLIGMRLLGTITENSSQKNRKTVVMEGEFKNAKDQQDALSLLKNKVGWETSEAMIKSGRKIIEAMDICDDQRTTIHRDDTKQDMDYDRLFEFYRVNDRCASRL
ncbi:hypothetical protein RclHR1_14910006 [Rhizophagus clarus]|nr:hypothetical protein RclHR1_14910006 [Rhizophagus clarus]